MVTEKYPDWDGTSPDRESPLVSREPSPKDWDQIVAEVLRHQSILRTLMISTVVPNYTVILPILPEDDFEIVDIKVIKTEDDGQDGDFIVFMNGGIEITERISLNVPRNRIVRVENLNLDLTSIRIGQSLSIGARKVSNCACKVFINCMIE